MPAGAAMPKAVPIVEMNAVKKIRIARGEAKAVPVAHSTA